MNTNKRIIAAAELLLMLPALLFMIALLVRSLLPQEYGLAQTAQQIIDLYAGKQWTLWVLLIAFPLIVLVSGCGTLLSSWNAHVEQPPSAPQTLATIRTDLATLFVAVATLTAGGILVIVILHMLAN